MGYSVTVRVYLPELVYVWVCVACATVAVGKWLWLWLWLWQMAFCFMRNAIKKIKLQTAQQFAIMCKCTWTRSPAEDAVAPDRQTHTERYSHMQFAFNCFAAANSN